MESSLECGVCFSDFNTDANRPKSLPCGHSLCASCVKDNLRISHGKMDCPFCRTRCGRGVKSLKDFPTTYALLSLLGATKQKSLSKTLPSKGKEKNNLDQKKQAECDRAESQLTKCKENLQKLLDAKEKQESFIVNINLGKNKLLEDYQREQKRLHEEGKKATAIKDQLDDVVAEGNDIIIGLEALQDRVRSASSIAGLNLAKQDVQRYGKVTQEWVKLKVKGALKENTNSKEEKRDEPTKGDKGGGADGHTKGGKGGGAHGDQRGGGNKIRDSESFGDGDQRRDRDRRRGGDRHAGGECYDCGQPGHIARDCRRGGGSRGGRGEESRGGEESREGGGSRGGRESRGGGESRRGGSRSRNVCYRCGEPGHIVRYCRAPSPSRSRSFSRSRSRSTSCSSRYSEQYDRVYSDEGSWQSGSGSGMSRSTSRSRSRSRSRTESRSCSRSGSGFYDSSCSSSDW